MSVGIDRLVTCTNGQFAMPRIAVLLKRRYPTAFALLTAWFLCVPGVSNAQVTIEVRVEIGSDGIAKTAVGPIVAPFDGWVRVTYFAAYQFGSWLSNSEQLILSRGGEVLAAETYPDTRFDLPTTGPYVCAGITGTNYYQVANLSTPVWHPTQVIEGDIIVMSAFSGVGATYIQQSDSVWDVKVNKLTNPCKYLNVGVEIVRDTLNLSFNPPADGSVYPSSGLIVDVTATVRGAGSTGDVIFEIQNHDYPDTPSPDTLIYFLDETGPQIDTTLTIDPVPVLNDTARAKLVVMDYWGVVDVTAKYVVNVASKRQTEPVVVHEKTERWPDDDDRDGIPDDWEEANGGRSMLNLLATCASPSAECTELDILWDEESSPFPTDTLGDGITKLREYKGVMKGSTPMRLSPEKREVFVDEFNNPHATWAISEARTQLGLEMIEVDGLKYDKDSTVVTGATPLMWRGGLPDSEPYHYVLVVGVTYGDPGLDKSPPLVPMTSSQEFHYYNGQVIINGIYQWSLLSVTHPNCLQYPDCAIRNDSLTAGNQVYGWTISDTSERYKITQTFLGSADNIWSQTGNTIPENAGGQAGYSPQGHWFMFGGAHISGSAFYFAEFPVTSSPSLINPFDHVNIGHPTNVLFKNAPSNDGKVMGVTLDDFLKRNTLHELGHALGMYRGQNLHPSRGSSVMRSGIGPAKTGTFSPYDKKQLIPK